MQPARLSFAAFLCLIPAIASAQESPPNPDPTPEPVIKELAKPGVALKDVKLDCPAKTKQVFMENATYCIESPVPKGHIPVKRGPAVWFHDNGKIARYGEYLDNKSTGVWISFHEDGSRDTIKGMEAGELHGLYIDFHPNGKRRSEKVFVKGKLNGLSKLWEEDGSLIVVKDYRDDKSVQTWVRAHGKHPWTKLSNKAPASAPDAAAPARPAR
jgi:hypothetical protein